MKIVLDTNVLISAFLTESGPSAQVFQMASRGHVMILSEYILEEFQRKMLEKLEWPPEEVAEAIAFLRKRAVLLNPLKEQAHSFSDAKDIPVLQLVLLCGAHYLITGDRKLLELKKIDATAILSPREAIKVL